MSGSSSPTRPTAGMEAPAVGAWVVDPDHAYVGFSGRRLSVASIRGRFTSVSGRIDIAQDPTKSKVEVFVETASVCSGSADRDERLRSAEHLDVARHPTAVFRSTTVRWVGGRARVSGHLELVGVTNAVELDVTYVGTVVDPWGDHRSVFEAETVLDREDWGLSWNVTTEDGGLLVSREILVVIEIEAIPYPASNEPGRATL